MYDTKLKSEDQNAREKTVTSLAVFNESGQEVTALMLPTSVAQVPAVEERPRLGGIEKHLRERAIEVLRLADSRANGQVTIARAVRQVLGIKVTGNLPWENTPQRDTLVALSEQGYLDRKGRGAEGLDSNGQAYVDAVFEITRGGRDFIERYNSLDAQWLGEQSVDRLGDAGLRALQVLTDHQGALSFDLTLDFLTSSPRLQKLIDRNCINVVSAASRLETASYVLDFRLTQTGHQHLQRALASGWRGWNAEPWSRDYQAKSRQYFLDMLQRSSDKVDEFVPAPAAAVVPQLASTRRGRGGFGMTARRFGNISEPTSFRYRGRRSQEIELFDHSHMVDADFVHIKDVTHQHNSFATGGGASGHKARVYMNSSGTQPNIQVVNSQGATVYEHSYNVVNFPAHQLIKR